MTTSTRVKRCAGGVLLVLAAIGVFLLGIYQGLGSTFTDLPGYRGFGGVTLLLVLALSGMEMIWSGLRKDDW